MVENVRSENVLTLLRFASNVACNFHSTFGAWLGSFASNGYFSFGKFLSVLINFDKFSIFAGLCSLVRGAFCVGVGLEYLECSRSQPMINYFHTMLEVHFRAIKNSHKLP